MALFDLRNAPMGAKAQIFSDPLFFGAWPLAREAKMTPKVRQVDAKGGQREAKGTPRGAKG